MRSMLLLLCVLVLPACGSGGHGSKSASDAPLSPAPSPTPTPTPGPAPTPAPAPVPVPVPVPPSSLGFFGPDYLASVTEGVAPLAVVFSAVGTKVNGSGEAVVQPPDGDFAAYRYAWDYGDGASGLWPLSGRSRNHDSGYVGAHVYERPGTYVCRLSVVAPDGTTREYAQRITVGGEWSTYYVSTSGNDANAGTSEAAPWRTLAKVVQNLAPGRRFLFRRGDQFSVGQGVSIDVPGPGLFGAYGPSSDPRPVFLGSILLYADDWRFMDLELRGGAEGLGLSLATDGGLDRVLALRMSVKDFSVGIGWSTETGRPTNDAIVLAGCEVTGARVNGLFVGARRLALLGNAVSRSDSSHVTRVWQANRSVIAHNEFRYPGGDRHALKLHGPFAHDPLPKTEYVVVSSNLLQGNLWTMRLGPQNAVSDEPVSHVLIERNRTLSVPMTIADYVVEARDVTIRNNVMDGSLAAERFFGVLIDSGGVVRTPGRVRVENNTMYRGSGGVEARMVWVADDAFEVVVRNNLGCFPGVPASAKSVLVGPASSQGNLLLDAAGLSNPGGGDFYPRADSPALGAASPSIRVWDDYNEIRRPQGGAPDVGAFER